MLFDGMPAIQANRLRRRAALHPHKRTLLEGRFFRLLAEPLMPQPVQKRRLLAFSLLLLERGLEHLGQASGMVPTDRDRDPIRLLASVCGVRTQQVCVEFGRPFCDVQHRIKMFGNL